MMKAVIEIIILVLFISAAIGIAGVWLWAMVEDELTIADEKQHQKDQEHEQ